MKLIPLPLLNKSVEGSSLLKGVLDLAKAAIFFF